MSTNLIIDGHYYEITDDETRKQLRLMQGERVELYVFKAWPYLGTIGNVFQSTLEFLFKGEVRSYSLESVQSINPKHNVIFII